MIQAECILTRCKDCGESTGRHLARYCDACRWKHRGKKARRAWTPERDERLREIWAARPRRLGAAEAEA